MIATYQMTTSLKSVSSMKLHRDLNINQRSAWFLAHRIRTALTEKGAKFSGPIEVDETYFGGKRDRMHNSKRKQLEGRGTVGKTAVAGLKDRESNKVTAKVVSKTDAATLQGFVAEHAKEGSTVYTDEAKAYTGLPFNHGTVKHSVSEYVNGNIHTNGIESYWSMLKRAHKGTFHKMSPKHLDRYIQEFSARHNLRELDTREIIETVLSGMEHKRLKYDSLIADNGLPSGARAA